MISEACPTCAGRLMPYAADDADHEGYSVDHVWCSKCGLRFVIDRFPGLERPTAAADGGAGTKSLALARDRAKGMKTRTRRPPFEAMVTREGTVLWSFANGEHVTIDADYAMKMAKALLHVSYEADQEMRRLRGATMWVAFVHPTRTDAIRVRHDDKEATFLRIKIRKPHECHSCRNKSEGPIMWREEPRSYEDVPDRLRGVVKPGTNSASGGGVSWNRWQFGSWARLCDPCATPVAKGVQALVPIKAVEQG